MERTVSKQTPVELQEFGYYCHCDYCQKEMEAVLEFKSKWYSKEEKEKFQKLLETGMWDDGK